MRKQAHEIPQFIARETIPFKAAAAAQIMDPTFFILLNARWLQSDPQNAKRLSQGYCRIAKTNGLLTDGCSVQIKYRGSTDAIEIDDSARIAVIGDAYYVKSTQAAAFAASCDHSAIISLFFEGTPSDARCVATRWEDEYLSAVRLADPTIRLESFDIPPATTTVVDSDVVLNSLYRVATESDRELYAVSASRFLDAPNIITALFSHVLAIQAEDNIRFPIQVKKLAEQLRQLLHGDGAVQIRRVEKSHLELWASVQGSRFGFLDGGVTRIPSVAGLQPMGLRVGVYSVRPGIVDPDKREQWRMLPFVLGDLIDTARRTEQRPEYRRLQEAARYTLEPLAGLEHLREFSDTRALLLHGPLITQFLQYDETEPNFLPFIPRRFLERYHIDESAVSARITDIPPDAKGIPMWNQFMAIYAYVLNELNAHPIPILGVVERPTGRAVTISVLHSLREGKIVTRAYVERVMAELERFDITDDFLFGCVLREGEYITPVTIDKNRVHGARPHWHPVVRQYPKPMAILIKTEDMNFPFRVEMNLAAGRDADFLARFLYHTARLLPRYAFPVGLDIVDKYAKVPDWISRGISAQLSAAVLRRALKTGDANVVAQVRLLLARGPRDFFYRPSARL